MLRGELHNRGSAGRCEACGEIFPCTTGVAIYEAVKRELEHPTPQLQPVAATPAPPTWTPPVVSWEDLEDRQYRCPACLHWWSSHGAEPDPEGCGMPTSTMDERERGIFETCGCLERPAPGSEMAAGLAREAERMRAYDRRIDRVRSTRRDYPNDPIDQTARARLRPPGHRALDQRR
jgi:hypothetical protein